MRKRRLSIFTLLALLSMVVAAFTFTASSAAAYGNESDADIAVTAEISGGTFKVKAADGQSVKTGFQIWVKTKADLHTVEGKVESGFTWTMISDGYIAADTYADTPESDCDIDGWYYVLVKAKDGAGTVSQRAVTYQKSQLTPVLSDVTINGDAILEVNYLPAGESAVIAASGDFTLTDEDGEYTSTGGQLSYTPTQGKYTLKLIPDGGEQTGGMEICVSAYSVFTEYTKIVSVTLNGNSFNEKTVQGLSATLRVNTEDVGTPLEADAVLKIGGQSVVVPLDENYTLDLDSLGVATADAGYGVYFFRIEITDGAYVQDYFDGYYYYARGASAAAASLAAELNGDICTLKASDVQNIDEQLLYQFVKWDYKGEYALTGWEQEDSLSLTLSKQGTYRFEVRVKGESADSYETRAFSKDIIKGTLESAGNGEKSITLADMQGSDRTKVTANNAYKVTANGYGDAVQYKFIVSTYGQWRVEEYYSPNNSFIWIPNKTGAYSIEVRILTKDSYGWNDISYTATAVSAVSCQIVDANDGWIYLTDDNKAVQIPIGYTATKNGESFAGEEGVIPMSEAGEYVLDNGTDVITFTIYTSEDYANVIAPLTSTQYDTAFIPYGEVRPVFAYDSSKNAYKYAIPSNASYHNTSLFLATGSEPYNKVVEGINNYSHFAFDVWYESGSKDFSHWLYGSAVSTTSEKGIVFNEDGAQVLYSNLETNKWYTVYMPVTSPSRADLYFTCVNSQETVMYLKNMRFETLPPVSVISALDENQDSSAFNCSGGAAGLAFEYNAAMNAYKYTASGSWGTNTVNIVADSNVYSNFANGLTANYAYFTFDIYYSAGTAEFDFAHMIYGGGASTTSANGIIYDEQSTPVNYASLVTEQWYTVYMPTNGAIMGAGFFSYVGSTVVYLRNMRLENTLPA